MNFCLGPKLIINAPTGSLGPKLRDKMVSHL